MRMWGSLNDGNERLGSESLYLGLQEAEPIPLIRSVTGTDTPTMSLRARGVGGPRMHEEAGVFTVLFAVRAERDYVTSSGARGGEATRELNGAGRAVAEEQGAPIYGDFVAWIAPSLQADLTRGVRPGLMAIVGDAGGAGDRMRQRHQPAPCPGRATPQRIRPARRARGWPRLHGAPDPGVFLFGLGVMALVGVAFGLVPAFRASGKEHRDLQRGSRRATAGGHGRLRG